VREPRRVALALLYEVFGAEAFDMVQLEPVRAFSTAELRVLRGMLEKRVNCPFTSSTGRLFDGVASLIGLRQMCSFEGQAAMELEFATEAAAGEESYNFRVQERHGSLVLDWEPMLRTIAEQPDDVAAARKFHNTLARMMVAVAEGAGESRVALTGGCFQNKYLTEIAIRELSSAGFHPYWHQRVPPNDGGIALGQIMAATCEMSQE
jgi:hydrogenase maturation protein HypF